MPIYEYKCDQCGHQLEMLQKISDEPATTCPACGHDSLRKLVSAAAFKLKGTGWYETDFKDKKPKENGKTSGSKKDDKSDAKSSKKDDKKTSDSTKTTKSSSSSASSE